MILLGSVYGINLFFTLALWLCGQSGNILLGILFIIVYRLSLWFAPVAVTIICWLPLRPKLPAGKKLVLNLIALLLSGMLFLVCYLIFGNWY